MENILRINVKRYALPHDSLTFNSNEKLINTQRKASLITSDDIEKILPDAVIVKEINIVKKKPFHEVDSKKREEKTSNEKKADDYSVDISKIQTKTIDLNVIVAQLVLVSFFFWEYNIKTIMYCNYFIIGHSRTTENYNATTSDNQQSSIRDKNLK